MKKFLIVCARLFMIPLLFLFMGASREVFIYKILICFGLCFTLYRGLVVDRDWFSPFTLFSSFYLCLSIYASGVSETYLPELSDYTMFLILLGSLSFLFGMVFYKIFGFIRKPKVHLASRSAAVARISDYSYWYLLLIGLMPFFYSIATNGLLILKSEGLSPLEIQEMRSSALLPIFYILTCLLNVAIITAMRKRKKSHIIIVVTVALASAVITVSKMTMVMTMFFISYGVIRNHLIKSNRLKITLLVFGILFFFVMGHFFRSHRGYDEGVFYAYEENYNVDVSAYTENVKDVFLYYMYIASPYTNFDYVVENTDQFTYGRRTIFPILSITQLKRVFDLEMEKLPIRNAPFNTHTFLADFYVDFGIWGCLFLSFTLGIIVYHFYAKAMLTDDPLDTAIYLYWGYATFMMFFNNHFTSQGYPIAFYLVISAYKAVSKHSRLFLFPRPPVKEKKCAPTWGQK